MSAAAARREDQVAILLVDDRQENLLVLEALLATLGERLVKARSGEEALRRLLEEDFAAVLLDVQMVGLDGFETAALIRQRDRSRHTPIIFLTAFETTDELIQRAYALGAVDFLFKPLHPEILTAKVAAFVELYRKTEEVKRQAELLRQAEKREHERKLAEWALRVEAETYRIREEYLRREQEKEKERLRFFTLSSDLLCIAAFDGTIKQASPAFERTLGVKPEEVVGQNLLDALHPEDRASARRELEQLAAGQEQTVFECRVLCRPEGWKWIAWHGRPFVAESLFYAAGRDVTEAKKIEQMKNDFISTVSHELRTPLTSINGSLRLMAGGLAGPLPPKAQELLAIACRNTERLTSLVNDILDMEKIESGKMEMRLGPTELGPLLSQAIEANRPFAEQLGVRIALEPPVPEVRVHTDGDRLIQVMTNLLSNAAKFSPPNETVVVSVSRHDRAVRIAVTDHGPGIPAEFRDRVFEKFAQADTSDGRKLGGTGLGLSIAKALVERLGGSIGFETERNVGTSFYLELPEHP